MRLICLNGWGGKLHEALIPWLRQMDPDVLCLQEVVHTPSSPKEWLTYRDDGAELPQRAQFLRDVTNALPDHIVTFCPAAEGQLWDNDQAYRSQWGLATFVRRSLSVIGQLQGFVHGTYGANGYGDHPRSRTAHVISAFDPEAQSPVTIAHMHGLRDLNGKQDTTARLAQAQRFKAMIEAVAERDTPVIACGDFNVLPDSVTFGVLAEIGLTDLVTTRGFKGTRTSHYRKPGRFADYMLINDRVDARHFDVLREPEVSDHCAMLLEFAVAQH